MVADGMTKPLTAVKHARFIQQLGLTNQTWQLGLTDKS
jgi:hypothetical protein